MKIFFIGNSKSFLETLNTLITPSDILKTESNFTKGYSEFLSFVPDIVLLYSCESAREFILKIREWSSVPIIVFFEKLSSSDMAFYLDLGADQCALSSLTSTELLARINALTRFPRVFSVNESPYILGNIEIDFASNKILKNGVSVSLTKTEMSIVRLLCQNRGTVVPYDYILKQIWGPYASDNKILRVLSTSIRKKLEDNPSSPVFLQTVFGVGYMVP